MKHLTLIALVMFLLTLTTFVTQPAAAAVAQDCYGVAQGSCNSLAPSCYAATVYIDGGCGYAFSNCISESACVNTGACYDSCTMAAAYYCASGNCNF